MMKKIPAVRDFIPLRKTLRMMVMLPAMALPAMAAPPAQSNKPEVQMMVKLKPSMTEGRFKALLSKRGGRQAGEVSKLGIRVIRVSAEASDQCRGELRSDVDVEYTEPDYKAEALGTANDPYFTQGSEWHLGKIQAPAAWDISTGASSIVVAVVDTGVLKSHPDLTGKVLNGYDFVANDTDATDENGHGTAVAGTVAPASNNGVGVAGVAWGNPILPVRVLDATGSGNYSAICNGIIYAADSGAKIINLSLGGTSSSQALQDAVNYAWNKQCVIVAAAGNSGNNIALYPAACTNVIAVSATDSADAHPSWSNYGSYVDVSAPGLDILTLYGSNQYAVWSGTSFSCPVASGVAALMASANPSLINSKLVDLLIKNSDDIGTPGYDVYFGNGRVNALRAVTAAKSFSNTLDGTAPVASITTPTNGAFVKVPSQNVTLSGTDNVAVTRIELYIDGRRVSSSTASSVTYSWNTRKIAAGAHKLQARAYDAAGNVGTSPIVTVYR
jgi:thermitase